MERKGSDPLVLLDACCLINLLATGRAEEIVAALPHRCATSRFVAVEEVGLDRLASLAVIYLATEKEKEDLLRFSTMLDAGEASICALAVHRHAVVATDDRKALRVLSRESPQLPTRQTTELLYDWVRLAEPSKSDIVDALRAIRDRARFYPRRDAPRFEWWAGFFR